MSTDVATEVPRRAVVIYDKPAAPHAVAELLAEVTKAAPDDALIHARYAPGVLPDRLVVQQAETLVQRLTGIGLSAEAIDPARLLNFHSAQTVHHALILENGLQIIDLEGRPDGLIPWDRIAVISAGQVPLESTQQYDWNDEHLFPTARRSHHEAHHTNLPPVMELWLVIGTDGTLIRIDQTRMNYETLGDAMTDSSTENFRLFLKRLTDRATNARLTPSTTAFLDLDSVLKYSFASTNELQRQTQLQTLIACRG